MNRLCIRALRGKPLSSTLPFQAQGRRSFHPEPRSFQNSAHASHRFVYRWIIQAIATPFALAYLCEKITERKGGDSGFRMELPDLDMALLTDPIKMKSQPWGTHASVSVQQTGLFCVSISKIVG